VAWASIIKSTLGTPLLAAMMIVESCLLKPGSRIEAIKMQSAIYSMTV
jgi:hypothetical protein